MSSELSETGEGLALSSDHSSSTRACSSWHTKQFGPCYRKTSILHWYLYTCIHAHLCHRTYSGFHLQYQSKNESRMENWSLKGGVSKNEKGGYQTIKKGVICHNGGTILPPATNMHPNNEDKGLIGSLRWNLSEWVLTTLHTMYFWSQKSKMYSRITLAKISTHLAMSAMMWFEKVRCDYPELVPKQHSHVTCPVTIQIQFGTVEPPWTNVKELYKPCNDIVPCR